MNEVPQAMLPAMVAILEAVTMMVGDHVADSFVIPDNQGGDNTLTAILADLEAQHEAYFEPGHIDALLATHVDDQHTFMQIGEGVWLDSNGYGQQAFNQYETAVGNLHGAPNTMLEQGPGTWYYDVYSFSFMPDEIPPDVHM